MIEMISVTKSFDGTPVLDGVSLSLERGDIAMICGPSGSGKSTLLRTINRMELIEQGDIRIGDVSVYAPGQSLCALRARVGTVFQHCNLFSHLSAVENVVMPLVKVKRIPRRLAVAQAMQLLEGFGLAARAGAYPDELSGGEKQRVAIVRCLAMEPLVMLFDEPTSALDWQLRSEVAANIRRLAGCDVTQVIVTHDLDFACAVGNRFFLLARGQLREVDVDELACCDTGLAPMARLRRAGHEAIPLVA